MLWAVMVSRAPCPGLKLTKESEFIKAMLKDLEVSLLKSYSSVLIYLTFDFSAHIFKSFDRIVNNL